MKTMMTLTMMMMESKVTYVNHEDFLLTQEEHQWCLHSQYIHHGLHHDTVHAPLSILQNQQAHLRGTLRKRPFNHDY